MKKAIIALIVLVVVAGGAAMIPVGGDDGIEAGPTAPGPALDLSEFSEEPPGQPVDLLFIHHSVGGTLLADSGPDVGDNCVYESHPNGGGLRAGLTDVGYVVHEASYGSVVGNPTDLFDWLPKFRDDMDRVLSTRLQDEALPEGRTNRIVVFKSCFPNSVFVGGGQGEGNVEGPELTVANARATLSALLPCFAEHPDVLFVYVTAPPMVAPFAEPLWKWAARRVRGDLSAPVQRQGAAWAREFNNWVRSPDGWLSEYPHRNVVAFDYYDVLTNEGESNMAMYPSDGHDPHPSAEGNRRAAERFVPFLNRALRRSGVLDHETTTPPADVVSSGEGGPSDGGPGEGGPSDGGPGDGGPSDGAP